MIFYKFEEFGNLEFTEEVRNNILSRRLTLEEHGELYDLLYRLNEYGLNKETLGARLRSYENGVIKVTLNTNLWCELTLIENDYSKLTVIDLYKINVVLV